jgi:hypothetical protein
VSSGGEQLLVKSAIRNPQSEIPQRQPGVSAAARHRGYRSLSVRFSPINDFSKPLPLKRPRSRSICLRVTRVRESLIGVGLLARFD